MTPAHKINAIVLTACTGGMAWLVLNIWVFKSDTFFNTLGCPIKSLTGFACPSCGITRALQLLFTGHLGAAFMTNPLSFIVGGIIVLAPIWITLDLYNVLFFSCCLNKKPVNDSPDSKSTACK